MTKLEPIYFDYAAATPLDPTVRAAMEPYVSEHFANASSLYQAARVAREATQSARHTVADLLGAKPTEILFTSGSTESNNTAIQGVLRAHPGAAWVTTAIEHEAVLGIVEPYRAAGHAASVVGVPPSGVVKPQDLTAAVTDETVLVSVMLANNEIGTIQPVAEVAKAVAAVRADRQQRGVKLPIYLHTDATQAAGYLDLHVTRLGVDLLTLNAGKIYGPKGVGLLYIRTGTVLEPLLYGGGQERGRRSGTENVAGVVGLAAAMKQAAAMREAEGDRQRQLRDRLLEALLEAIPQATFNGDRRHRLPGNISLTIPGADGETMVLHLDVAGIQASTGSACSVGSDEPSHVLVAIGRSTAEANCNLRLTLGRHTTAAHIDSAIATIPGVVARVRQLQSM